MKYNFSITTARGEKFEVTGADSFDEAIKQVEKGVYHRDLELNPGISSITSKVPTSEVPEVLKVQKEQSVPEVPISVTEVTTETGNGAVKSNKQPV